MAAEDFDCIQRLHAHTWASVVDVIYLKLLGSEFHILLLYISDSHSHMMYQIRFCNPWNLNQYW